MTALIRFPKNESKIGPPGRKIGVVIPAFNERENLSRLLVEFETLVRSLTNDLKCFFTVIIVDDGSTDSTYFHFLESCKTSTFDNGSVLQFEILRLPINLGIGRAVQTGFIYLLREGADIFIQVDGDGQHPPSEIPRLIQPLLAGQADIMIGSRYIPGHRTNVSSFARELGTRYFSALIRFLTKRKIYDVTSGFRAFSRPVIAKLVDDYPDDFPEVQAYVVLHHHESGITKNSRQLQIKEIPVRMRRRDKGNSSITFPKIFYYVLKVTLASVLERFRGSLVSRSVQNFSSGIFSLGIGIILAVQLSSWGFAAEQSSDSFRFSGAFDSLNFLSWKEVPGNRLKIEFWAIAGCVGLGIFLLEMVRRRKIQERYSLLWFLTLGVILTLTVRREWLSNLATTIGIHYPPTALLLTFVFFLMSILIHFSMVVSQLLSEKQKLAQEIALLDVYLRQQQKRTLDVSENRDRKTKVASNE